MIFKVQRYAYEPCSEENNYLFEQNMVIFGEKILGIFLFHFFFLCCRVPSERFSEFAGDIERDKITVQSGCDVRSAEDHVV